MQLLLGADPEVFVREGGNLRTAHALVPGTKTSPYPVPFGAVQVDGMALEYNIDPAKDEGEFFHAITNVMATLKGMIPKGCELDISPVAFFNEDYLDSMPDEAKVLGCDPDFNAYTGRPNQAPEAHPSLRTAAGHIHLGWTQAEDPHDPAHFGRCIQMAKQMDFALGLLGVIYDADTIRQNMYGQAGAFRPKPYGMEYRVLSNFWLKDERLIRKVYRHAERGFNEVVFQGINHSDKFGTLARDAIRLHDEGAARALYKRMGWGDV